MGDRLPGRKRDYTTNGTPASVTVPLDGATPAAVTLERVGFNEAGEVEPVFLQPVTTTTLQGVPVDRDGAFAGRWQGVWEYCSVAMFRGKPRETSSLLFFREHGMWKVCLSDRENNRVLFRGGCTFEDCLDALEAAVRTPGADWRPQRKKASR